MNNQFTYPKEKIRFAILTFFFAQGLCMASWASRIPDFKDVCRQSTDGEWQSSLS